jgi:hypothetical protein
MSPEKNSEETQKLEKLQIPKSREIFTGDINAAVITVQQITGIEITPEWWDKYVQKNGTIQDTGEILDNFDEAFSEYVLELQGFEGLGFSDRDLAEIKAIQEIKDALQDGRLKEDDLDQYIKDLIAWIDQEFPIDIDDESKVEYERSIYAKLNPETERLKIDIPNEFGISFELNSQEMDLDEDLLEALALSLRKLSERTGEYDVFNSIRVVLCEDGAIEGGGQALAREGIVIINISKPPLIEETGKHLTDNRFLNPGDWTSLNVPNDSAIALTLIHELGHVAEFRKFGDYGVVLSGLDRSESPTRYGGQDASEDFAESFAYAVFGGELEKSRLQALRENGLISYIP